MYAIHDSDIELKKQGAFEVSRQQALELNKKGYGIFYTPNDFNGARKAANLVKINYWFVDIDEGEKSDMLSKINNLPIKPTMIIESKKGYHCYWKANDATEEKFRDIQTGLISRLNGDKACKDLARLLRCPDFYHMKDINNPFLIKIVYQDDRSYNESRMLLAYELPKPKYKKLEYKGDKADFLVEGNWDKIFKLNTISEGGRNNGFTRICFWLRDEGFSRDIVLNTLLRMNSKISNPLDEHEIRLIVRGKL